MNDNPLIKLWVEYYDLIWDYRTLVYSLLAIIAIVNLRRYLILRKKNQELKRMQEEKEEKLRNIVEQRKNIQEAIYKDDIIEIEDVKPITFHCKGPSG